MRDLNPEDANWIDNAVEWIGEALEHIGAAAQLVKRNCILDIKDFKSAMPADLYYINQVSVNESSSSINMSSQMDEIKVMLAELIANSVQNNTNIAENVIQLESGELQSNVSSQDLKDASNLKKSSDRQINELNAKLQVLGNEYYNQANSMLAYCTTNFPEGLHCEDCVNKAAKHKECYYAEEGYIKTSFETGKVCISYMAFPTDADCYPLVPDDISYKEAMFWYIFKKMLLRGMQAKNGFDYMTANQQWQYYCTQARNAAVYPDIDRYESFMNQWVRLIPDINRHSEGFENLNTRENVDRGKFGTS